MAKLTIPDQYFAGFKVLLHLTDEQINLLTSNFGEGGNLGELTDLIKKKIGIKEKDAKELVVVLGSLLDFDSRNVEQVSKDLVDGLKEAKLLKSSNSDSHKLQLNLKKLLLNDGTIGLALKALNLRSEVENLFIDSRIISDIRPSFGNSIEKKFKTASIIHNLKITYHIGPKHEEIYFTLNSDDLKELKANIIRAEQKEISIKNTIGQIIHFTELKS